MTIRDRIKELRRVRACDLRPNPKNWRTHPKSQQDALRSILAEVGIAGAVLARECDDGSLMLIDGHLRADTSPDTEWPVLVLDVSESEADKMLASYDPLSAIAEADTGKLETLLRDIETGSQELAGFLSSVAERHGIIPDDGKTTELKQIDTTPPPAMSWVLIGIPTVRFGEIAAQIEELATLATVCETTVSDGD